MRCLLPPLQPCSPFCVLSFVRDVQRFRGGLVFKAHRLLYNSTLGLRVIEKQEEKVWSFESGSDRGGNSLKVQRLLPEGQSQSLALTLLCVP